MNFDIKLITDWRFLVPASVALLSLAFSMFNFIIGKLVASKIVQNDLKHVTADIDSLKIDNKEIKIDLKKDLNKIFRRLGRLEKIQYAQREICNERHSKDKK